MNKSAELKVKPCWADNKKVREHCASRTSLLISGGKLAILLWFGYCQCLFSLLYYAIWWSHTSATHQETSGERGTNFLILNQFIFNEFCLRYNTVYTKRSPFISQGFPGWSSWTILRMMYGAKNIQCTLVNWNLRELKYFTLLKLLLTT